MKRANVFLVLTVISSLLENADICLPSATVLSSDTAIGTAANALTNKPNAFFIVATMEKGNRL